MLGQSRRVIAQGAATLGVLTTAIAISATGGVGGAAAAAKPAAKVTASVPSVSPVTAPPPAPGKVKIHHAPKPQLRHAKHEKWSKLLPSTPHGWTVNMAAHSVSASDISKGFRIPSVVRQDLHFDGFRRAVDVASRNNRLGVVEQVYQFRNPTGATAWFRMYAASNHPGPKSMFKDTFIANPRSMGFTTNKTDGAGYHFGVGISLQGDMVVYTRIYSTRNVTKSQVKHQTLRTARPVAKGITHTNLFSELAHVKVKKQKSPTT